MSNFSVDLEQQLARLGKDIQGFVEQIVPLANDANDFIPSCDIVESKKSYKLLLDLPGLSKKKVDVALRDNVLTVQGERTPELEDGEVYERRERSYGAFSRSFALPETVDLNSIDASFKNGILKITMNKSEKVRNGQSIPIS